MRSRLRSARLLVAGLIVALAVPLAVVAGPAEAGPAAAVAAHPADGTDPAPTTTSLTIESADVHVGDAVHATVQVTGTDPTGSVKITEDQDGTTTVLANEPLTDGSADLTVSGLPIGSHDLVATYSGDESNLASSSDPSTVTVERLTSTVTLVLPATVEAGSQVTAQVAVQSGDVAGTGSVTLQRDGTDLSTATLANGQATLTFPAGDVAGESTIAASFAGDASLTAGSDSANLRVVARAPRVSTTTIEVKPNASVKAGTGLTATVTVTAASGAAPTGTVTLTGAGAARTALLSGGRAVFSLASGLAVGSHTLEAAYGGDDITFGSTGSQTVSVTRLNSSLMLTTTSSSYGYSSRIAVVATGAPLTADGTVHALVNGRDAATPAHLSGGHATLILPHLWTPGTRIVTVQYDGGASHNPASKSVAVKVSKARTSVSAGVASVGYGTVAQVKVTVHGAGTAPTGLVQIYRGTTYLASKPLSGGSVSIPLPRMNPGRYGLTVKYLGSGNHLPSSSGVTLVVTKSTPSISSSVSGSLIAGRSLKLNITVSKSSPAPSGTVSVLRGGHSVGSAKLNAHGQASITLPGLGVGLNPLKITYAGDVRYKGLAKTITVRTTRARSFGDGTFRVGYDIPAGLYRVKVPAGSLCYWAREKDNSGSLSSILDNQLEEGYGLIRVLPTDAYIDSNDCGTWRLVSETANWPFYNKSFPGDGAFLVNKDVAPGTYAEAWSDCYIEFDSDVTGSLDDIIQNYNTDDAAEIWFTKNVFAVRVSGCSSWSRLGPPPATNQALQSSVVRP